MATGHPLLIGLWNGDKERKHSNPVGMYLILREEFCPQALIYKDKAKKEKKLKIYLYDITLIENFPDSSKQRIYKVVFLMCFAVFSLELWYSLIKPVELVLIAVIHWQSKQFCVFLGREEESLIVWLMKLFQ